MDIKEKTKIQKEIVSCVPANAHGRLHLAPRVGKTKIIIDIIKRDKPKSILWVTPSAELAEKDIPEEFIKWKAKTYLKRLTTSTWASLNKVTGYYDTIVLDEEQYATENNLKSLLDKSLTYGNIISITGSPTKHDSKKDLYRQLNLSVLYTLNINEAVDLGILSNYTIKVVEVDMSLVKDIDAGNSKVKFKTSEKAQYDYLTSQMQQAMFQRRKDVKFRMMARMRAIQNSPSKRKVASYLMENLEGRKMFFSPTIELAEYLSTNTFHSKTNDEGLKKFQSGDCDTLSLVNSGGIGFTYKEIDHLVIVQCDSDKNGLTSQKISRCLLKQPDYKATIWIICLKGTQDEKWVESALSNFDKSKIEYINFKNMK